MDGTGGPTDALEFTCACPVESSEIAVAKRNTDNSDDYNADETQSMNRIATTPTEIIFQHCDNHDTSHHIGDGEDDYRGINHRFTNRMINSQSRIETSHRQVDEKTGTQSL